MIRRFILEQHKKRKENEKKRSEFAKTQLPIIREQLERWKIEKYRYFDTNDNLD